jgi:hypothetical protein
MNSTGSKDFASVLREFHIPLEVVEYPITARSINRSEPAIGVPWRLYMDDEDIERQITDNDGTTFIFGDVIRLTGSSFEVIRSSRNGIRRCVVYPECTAQEFRRALIESDILN